VFDSSVTMAEAVAQGVGVALLPVRLFARELQQGRLIRPFTVEIAVGDYWLTSLKSKRKTAGMLAFQTWLMESIAGEDKPPMQATAAAPCFPGCP
jgi:LysR family transcriptional regulator of beta-lactamase